MTSIHPLPTDQQTDLDLLHLPTMPKVILGRSGIVSTRIGLGTAAWPLNIPYEQTVHVLQIALTGGIRHIDMAPYYGTEELIGRALQEIKIPADAVLATKVGSYLDNDLWTSYNNYSARTVYQSVERSLKRLGVDHIHIIHIHNAQAQDLPQIFAKGGALAALLDLKAQGVISSIGMATLGLDCQLAAVACGEIDHIQPFHTYTLLNQTAKTELFPKARAANLSILNNAPYAGYILATGSVPGARYNYGPASPEVIDAVKRMEVLCAQKGVSLPTAAVAFSLQESDVDVTVIASGKPRHVIGWVQDLAASLTHADLAELVQAAGGPFRFDY
jgi:D-threo-aldose 1-dehydrogenase